MTQQQTTTANTRADASAVAAVCDKKGPDAARMAAFLEAQGMSATRWYAIRDLDDVDADATAGRLGTVVFVSWQDLLEGIWTGEVNYGRWLAAGAKVRFVDSPRDDAAACLATLSQAWDRYDQKRRKRNAIAGLVMSFIVIAAAFILIQS